MNQDRIQSCGCVSFYGRIGGNMCQEFQDLRDKYFELNDKCRYSRNKQLRAERDQVQKQWHEHYCNNVIQDFPKEG